MKQRDVRIGGKYHSRKNPLLIDGGTVEYEVVKKNKTTCWVRLWIDGKKKKTIYKNVGYGILMEKL